MKVIARLFPFVFLFCAGSVSAQYAQQVTKTGFNNFVEKASVQWAVYANDTASLPGFTQELIKKLQAGKIKAVGQLDNGSEAENKLIYKTPADLKLVFNHEPVRVYDSLGNELPGKPRAINLEEEFQKPSVEFYQIFYVEQNQLLCYVTRIAPQADVVTPAGLYLGHTEYASFCINKKYNNAAGKQDKMTSLGKFTKTIYSDSIPPHDRLKMLYASDLVPNLWPAILSGKIAAYTPGSKEKLATAQLLVDYTGTKAVDFPMYDSLGNPMGSRKLYMQQNPTDFKRVDITEEYFYDETKDIIICKIPEIVLFKYTENTDAGLVASLRIVF